MYSLLNNRVEKDQLIKLRKALSMYLFNDDFVIDSKEVIDGVIFCAYPGLTTDGRNFIENAVINGAKFVLLEDDFEINVDVKHYKIKNLKSYVGVLLAEKYGYLTLSLPVIGVTGTNGKTSITHWLSQIYHLQNISAGIIGTTGSGVYPDMTNHNVTTPNCVFLQKLLADFADKKVKVVSMEVSSHALDQDRVNGVFFQTAIFTNLTQDHLDYHHDIEQYYLAKKKLFLWLGLRQVIINLDDCYGKRLYHELLYEEYNKFFSPPVLISYGINNGDVRAESIDISLSGVSFELCYKNDRIWCNVGVIGRFNIYNLLAVACKLILDGYTLPYISTLFLKMAPVKGRMETLINRGKPLVVVDYSHTPDALYNALLTLKNINFVGKLYCVFGCGGNRDYSKRRIMGEIASSLADFVILTSDNPRYEDPSVIIEHIKEGIKSDNYQIIQNRQEAIDQVLKLATHDDIVLIAGKGHENYQEINGVKYCFSDINVAKESLL